MTSTTPYLNLILHGTSEVDEAKTFLEYRTAINGVDNSNMVIIDTAIKTRADDIAALQLVKGAIPISASYASPNNYAATTNPTSLLSTYQANTVILLRLNQTSNGAVNLNINGLGAKAINKITSTGAGQALQGTDLIVDKYYLCVYDGSVWVLINPTVDLSSLVVDTNGNFAHADTSTQASVTNTSPSVIQSVGLDGMGHVTSLSSVDIIPVNGWTPAGETWTYASATTFTVSGDVRSKYDKGTKIKLTQTTNKYFIVTDTSYSAPNTTVTITGGDDYTLANAAITSPLYSYIAAPQGFPSYFNFTPAWNAATVNPAIGNGTITARFSIAGRMIGVFIRIAMSTTTTFGTGTYTFGLPTAAAQVLTGGALELDSGSQYYIGTVRGSNATSVSVISNAGPSSWSNTQPQTWASGDWLELSITYFI